MHGVYPDAGAPAEAPRRNPRGVTGLRGVNSRNGKNHTLSSDGRGRIPTAWRPRPGVPDQTNGAAPAKRDDRPESDVLRQPESQVWSNGANQPFGRRWAVRSSVRYRLTIRPPYRSSINPPMQSSRPRWS